MTGVNEDEVKLVDFGLSKLVAGSMVGASRAHTMVGTPSYLAPEIENMKTKTQSLDLDTLSKEEDLDLSDGIGAYDNKVDAWSLGVLHCMSCSSRGFPCMIEIRTVRSSICVPEMIYLKTLGGYY